MQGRKVDKVIVHCSDSPDHMDIGFVEINQWHEERGFTPYNGWLYCGYHYIIRRNGDIEAARPEDVKGIHCAGQNSRSIGICWVGRDLMTKEQGESLINQCQAIMRVYGLDASQIYGHYEFNKSKSCPRIDMDEFREEVKL